MIARRVVAPRDELIVAIFGLRQLIADPDRPELRLRAAVLEEREREPGEREAGEEDRADRPCRAR